MAVEVFGNIPTTTVSSGGTDAPAAGTQQTWTVTSSTGFPAVSSSAIPPTQIHVADVALNSEMIQVINISGTTWTVVRGAEGTTPVSHGAGFTIYQVVSAGAYSQLRNTDWLNVATQFGADPTGSTDSTAAIQAAIAAAAYVASNDASGVLGAAKATVYFPGGTYLISSGPLVLTHGHSIRLTGAGDGATLKSSANAIIDFDGLNGLTEGSIEIDHLGFDATGGHVFQNANIHGQLSLHDLAVRQRSAGYSVFYMDDTVSGHTTGLYQAIFRNIRYTLDAGTRSIEAWHILTTTNDSTTDVTFEHISGPVPTGYTGNDGSLDTTQYQFFLSCPGTSNAHLANLVWRDCIMSSPFGGIIKVGGTQGVLIENVSAFNTYDGAITNSLYYLTKDPTNNSPVQGAVIRNCVRTTGLGNGSTQPPYDVLLDSTCKNVLIENYVVGYSPSTAYIDVGSAAGVVVIQPGGAGASGAPVISNQSADTIVIGQGNVVIGGASTLTYDQLIASYTPSAWWKLADAPASSTAADSSGNGWTGTVTSVTFGETPGPIVSTAADTAALFTGSSKIVSSFTPGSLSAFSICAWVNMEGATPAASERIASTDNTFSTNNGFDFLLNFSSPAWYPQLAVGNGSGNTNGESAVGVFPLATSGWQFICATFAAGATAVKMYVNAVKTGNSGTLSGTMSTGADGLNLGVLATSGGSHFAGQMAQVAFLPATLNQTQITTLYNAGLATIVTSVTAANQSIVVTGNAAAPAIATGTLSAPVVTLTDAATIALNASQGNDFRVTIGASRTLGAPSIPTDGQEIRVQVTQGGSGSFTLSYNAVYDFGTAGTPTLTTTAGAIDVLTFTYNATKVKWLFLGAALGF